METLDFQAWVYSQVEVKQHFVNGGVWNFPCVLFGMPHTIRGYSNGNGGIFYLDFKVLESGEEEICISSNLINQCNGDNKEALKLRVVEFFVSCIDNDRKRKLLSEYNRSFGGGISLFLSMRDKNPQVMSAKELINQKNEMWECEEAIKDVDKLKEDILKDYEKYSQMLKAQIEKKLEKVLNLKKVKRIRKIKEEEK